MTRRELLLIALAACAHVEPKKDTMNTPENAVYYVEVVSSDVPTTRALYEKAYGWHLELTPALGNAYVASLPDGSRFGIRAPLRPDEAPVVRTYIRVADIDRATKAAEEQGAKIALAPTELPGQGKIAIYILGGTEQGLWELP